MAFRRLWRGQPSPELLQPAGRGPRGGVGEGSVCYIYIRTKGLFVMYIGTEGLRGCIRVSEGTDVGSTRQRHKASADYVGFDLLHLVSFPTRPAPTTLHGHNHTPSVCMFPYCMYVHCIKDMCSSMLSGGAS